MADTVRSSITIRVKTLAPSTHELQVAPNATVGQVQDQLAELLPDAPVSQQRLIFKGRALQDRTQTLTQAGVGDGDALHMVLRIRQPDSGADGTRSDLDNTTSNTQNNPFAGLNTPVNGNPQQIQQMLAAISEQMNAMMQQAHQQHQHHMSPAGPPQATPHVLSTVHRYLDRLQAPDFSPRPIPVAWYGSSNLATTTSPASAQLTNALHEILSGVRLPAELQAMLLALRTQHMSPPFPDPSQSPGASAAAGAAVMGAAPLSSHPISAGQRARRTAAASGRGSSTPLRPGAADTSASSSVQPPVAPLQPYLPLAVAALAQLLHRAEAHVTGTITTRLRNMAAVLDTAVANGSVSAELQTSPPAAISQSAPTSVMAAPTAAADPNAGQGVEAGLEATPGLPRQLLAYASQLHAAAALITELARVTSVTASALQGNGAALVASTAAVVEPDSNTPHFPSLQPLRLHGADGAGVPTFQATITTQMMVPNSQTQAAAAAASGGPPDGVAQAQRQQQQQPGRAPRAGDRQQQQQPGESQTPQQDQLRDLLASIGLTGSGGMGGPGGSGAGPSIAIMRQQQQQGETPQQDQLRDLLASIGLTGSGAMGGPGGGGAGPSISIMHHVQGGPLGGAMGATTASAHGTTGGLLGASASQAAAGGIGSAFAHVSVPDFLAGFMEGAQEQQPGGGDMDNGFHHMMQAVGQMMGMPPVGHAGAPGAAADSGRMDASQQAATLQHLMAQAQHSAAAASTTNSNAASASTGAGGGPMAALLPLMSQISRNTANLVMQRVQADAVRGVPINVAALADIIAGTLNVSFSSAIGTLMSNSDSINDLMNSMEEDAEEEGVELDMGEMLARMLRMMGGGAAGSPVAAVQNVAGARARTGTSTPASARRSDGSAVAAAAVGGAGATARLASVTAAAASLAGNAAGAAGPEAAPHDAAMSDAAHAVTESVAAAGTQPADPMDTEDRAVAAPAAVTGTSMDAGPSTSRVAASGSSAPKGLGSLGLRPSAKKPKLGAAGAAPPRTMDAGAAAGSGGGGGGAASGASATPIAGTSTAPMDLAGMLQMMMGGVANGGVNSPGAASSFSLPSASPSLAVGAATQAATLQAAPGTTQPAPVHSNAITASGGGNASGATPDLGAMLQALMGGGRGGPSSSAGNTGSGALAMPGGLGGLMQMASSVMSDPAMQPMISSVMSGLSGAGIGNGRAGAGGLGQLLSGLMAGGGGNFGGSPSRMRGFGNAQGEGGRPSIVSDPLSVLESELSKEDALDVWAVMHADAQQQANAGGTHAEPSAVYKAGEPVVSKGALAQAISGGRT